MRPRDAEIAQPQIPTVTYRRAGILDVPLIFQVLLEGAESGVFSDAFIQRNGSAQLLGYALRSVLRPYFQLGRVQGRIDWKMICLAGGEAIGFFTLERGTVTTDDLSLAILALGPEHRNQGIGSAVLDDVLLEVPAGAQLVVHCTKYARAMQRLLKRRGMMRNARFNTHRMEEYRSAWPPISNK